MTLVYDSGTSYDSVIPYEGTSATGYFFTPPLTKTEPPYLPDSTFLQKSLWMHYENRYRGVNVWVLSDNSVVQSDPTAENSNTNMADVFPWDPFNPSAPYVRSIYIDSGANPQSPTEHDVSHNPYVVAYFAGGSTYPISNAMYALLVGYTAHGTGYADCMSPL